jgi:hypothetical protein
MNPAFNLILFMGYVIATSRSSLRRSRTPIIRCFSSENSFEFSLRRNSGDGTLEVQTPLFPVAFRIDLSSSQVDRRLKQAKSELVTRAIGSSRLVVDLTAGLGRDALTLAATGRCVLMFERNPSLHALLEDALVRLQHHQPMLRQRLHLFPRPVDSTHLPTLLSAVRDSITTTATAPQLNWEQGQKVLREMGSFAVFLDPMYPTAPDERTAKSRKETQILHLLTRTTEPRYSADNPGAIAEEESSLFRAACALHSLGATKIVVKRGRKDRALLVGAGSGGDIRFPLESSERIVGSTQRFDVYLAQSP